MKIALIVFAVAGLCACLIGSDLEWTPVTNRTSGVIAIYPHSSELGREIQIRDEVRDWYLILQQTPNSELWENVTNILISETYTNTIQVGTNFYHVKDLLHR